MTSEENRETLMFAWGYYKRRQDRGADEEMFLEFLQNYCKDRMNSALRPFIGRMATPDMVHQATTEVSNIVRDLHFIVDKDFRLDCQNSVVNVTFLPLEEIKRHLWMYLKPGGGL